MIFDATPAPTIPQVSSEWVMLTDWRPHDFAKRGLSCTYSAYEWFRREHGVQEAFAMAVAERERERRGWLYTWEPDVETVVAYNEEAWWCEVRAEGSVDNLASMGGIIVRADCTWRSDIIRIVEAEVALEALSAILAAEDNDREAATYWAC